MSNNLREEIDNKRCVLCGRGAEVGEYGDSFSVNCKTCAQFRFTRTGIVTIHEEDKQLLRYLSIHTRQASERGEVVTFNTANWKDIAHSYEQTPVFIKINKLLELTASRARPGHPVHFEPHSDYPLVYAYDSGELAFLLQSIRELGYLEPTNDGWTYVLKAKGWEQLQSGQTQGIPGKCFVAMSFDKSLEPAWLEGIEPALRFDCKMDPIRLDWIEHNEKICDKIIVEIRSSQFLIADVTLRSPGVYFEAGFAMGLGRPVIWSCRDDDLKNVHFDTRQYNHIVWKEPADLREKLEDRIKATIPGAT